MKKHLAAYFDNAIAILLLLVAGLTPLLFFNQLTEFFEMPKLVMLIAVTILVYGLWIFSCIIKGKVAITRTPLDIPLLLLLGVILLSTFLSNSHYAAIFGSLPKVHGSAVSWVTYILLYFVTVSNLKSVSQVRTLLYVLNGSAVLTALVTLLAFFHVFLPYDFAQAVNFTPTGSSFSTVAFLLLMLPLPLMSLLQPNKYMPVPLALVLASLFGVTIALIGSLSIYVVLAIAVVLCLIASKAQVKTALGLFIVPVALIIVTLGLAYIPQLPAGVNGVQQLTNNFPKEIQLPLGISWKVSASAFRDAIFVGTGPATYLYDFTSYKPVEFNTLNYWNFSFDTAHDEFLQALATIGLFGFLLLLFFCLVVLNNSRKAISGGAGEQHAEMSAAAQESHTAVQGEKALLPALAISAVVSIILLAVHATTLVSIVVTFFILAALMMSQKAIRSKVMMLSMGINASTSDNRHFDLFPIIIFIIFLVGAVPALIMLTTDVQADYYHRLALSQANQNGTLTYQYLQKAEALNPTVDLYRVDMAQTNFALANALAIQKGPSKSNPKGSLTDNDKKTIQTLLSQAVNESRASVAISPRSARNWEVLASIYRNISGVAQNALVFSLDSYGRAIQVDPLNPALRVSVGGIYYSIKNYDNAIRFFSDAANLKPDYANAYFNLAVALQAKGDLTNAKAVAQQTVNLLSTNTNSADYKIASQLLKNLNSAKGTQTPASSNSALQNSQANVETGNAPQLTPVPTVQPNTQANLPQNLKTAPTKK